MSSFVVSSTIMAMLISSDRCSPRDPDEWRQMISDNLITRPSINYDNLFVSIRASTSFSISLTAEQKYRGGELNCTFTIPHCLGRSSIYAKMKFSFSPSQKLQLTQCDSQITKRFLESVVCCCCGLPFHLFRLIIVSRNASQDPWKNIR